MSLPLADASARPLTGSYDSFWARWLGVYVSPSSTFRSIVQRPDVFLALYVPALTSLLVAVTIHVWIGAEQLARIFIAQDRASSSIPPEVVDRMVQSNVQMSWLLLVLGPTFQLLFTVVVAGISFLMLNALFKARLDYRANNMIVAVASYAALPTVVRDLANLAAILLADPKRINLSYPAPTNLGHFLNPLEISKPLLAFAGSLDIFSFWSIALLGIGYSAATEGKAKPLTLGIVFFGLWLIVTLAKAGMAMVA